MIREREVLRLVRGLKRRELLRWIESGWVLPRRDSNDYVFEAIDVARVRLIHEIRRDMRVNDEGVPLILSLMDQVYGLRHQLRQLANALERQPEPVRRSIIELMRNGPGTER